MVKRSIAVKILIFFATFLILGLISLGVELTLRAIQGRPLGQNPYPYLENGQIAEYVEVFHWRLIPNSEAITPEVDKTRYNINSLGFRGPEITERKPPNTIRLLFLGDSSVFGWRTQIEQTFPGFLQHFLQKLKSAKRIEIINAGAIAYTSFQGRLEIERWLRLDPDVVLLSFGWNDSYQAIPTSITDAEYHNRSSSFGVRLGFKLQRLASLRALMALRFNDKKLKRAPVNLLGLNNALNAARKNVAGDLEKAFAEVLSSEVKFRVGLEEYSQNLKAMVEKCRDKGIRVAFTPISVPGPYLLKMKDVAKNLDVALVESEPILVAEFTARRPKFTRKRMISPDRLNTDMRSQPDLFLDDCHPNVEGYELIARSVADRLGRKIISGAPLAYNLGFKQRVKTDLKANQ